MPPKKKPAASHRGISRAGRRYNWIPDLPDQRDLRFAERIMAPAQVPNAVDLRPNCSPVVDQGKIGSCTGNALAGAIEFLELKELREKSAGPEVFTQAKFAPVSRLFIYYNERAIEGTTDQDAGAQIRDGVKSLNQTGCCREAIWKYATPQVFKKPSAAAYKEATKHEIAQYLKLGSLSEMKQCLATGFPFAFGFTVYESFESPDVAKTGLMPMPSSDERVLGGHAVLAVGYDDSSKQLIVRNSWGTKWGDQGYFRMPYAYVEGKRLAQDFWTIRK
ncbi:MAG: C1 family peptidase [Bdellovibrionota bacterium]